MNMGISRVPVIIRSYQNRNKTQDPNTKQGSKEIEEKKRRIAPDPDSSPSLLHANSITVLSTDRGFMNSCLSFLGGGWKSLAYRERTEKNS